MASFLQNNLFEKLTPDAPAVPSLRYIPDYITTQQEAELLSDIDKQPWLTDLKRLVQHYGWKYDYKARNITSDLKLGPLPSFLKNYCDGLKSDNIFSKSPDQVIINEYQPGQGISSHIDCVPCFGGTIVSLSLVSACIMEFKSDTNKVQVLLEPRSLVILSGDARYKWQHAIPSRKTDKYNGIAFTRSRRISLTFRNMIYTQFEVE